MKSNHMKSTRRDFLQTGVAAAAVAASGASLGIAQESPTTAPADILDFETPESTREGDMLFRTLGRTGEKVSLLGLGGAHIGRLSEAQAVQLMRSAIDRGVTFMDNCWDYSNGQCEVLMGAALRDGYRERVFLMTKFDGRTKAAAARQIDESLQRLQTDRIDLIQLHENIRMNDPDRFFAAGGAVEAVQDAKQAGKVRYIGFTGHKTPEMHLKMIDLAKKREFQFDAVQMPVNVLDAHFRSFAREVIPVALREGIGILAMKTMAGGVLGRANYVTPVQCLHYAMNLPSSVVICGMENMQRLEQNLEAVKTFKPMAREEVAAILAKTRTYGAAGTVERFKTSTGYDGTSRRPDWMG